MTSEKVEPKQQKKRGGVRKLGDPKQKETKRSRSKYRALDPSINLKSRYEEIEDLASYADTLSPEDKEWLNTFSQEYICANLAHGKEVLHNTKETRKICYDKNNSRNRCVYSKEKSQGTMNYIEDMRNVETKKKED